MTDRFLSVRKTTIWSGLSAQRSGSGTYRTAQADRRNTLARSGDRQRPFTGRTTGSFFEQIKVIGPLTDPTRYGGRPEDAFEVVRNFLRTGGWGYYQMMTARPQAVGYGLTDSPAGLVGWMLVHGDFGKWT